MERPGDTNIVAVNTLMMACCLLKAASKVGMGNAGGGGGRGKDKDFKVAHAPSAILMPHIVGKVYQGFERLGKLFHHLFNCVCVMSER